MSFIVGAAAHGSPGVSTALQLIAAQWPQAPQVPVLVEADSTGGVFAARFELSLVPGMVSLAESLRKFEGPPVLDHAQRLPSGVACVPISPSATAAAAQLRTVGGLIGSYLRDAGHPAMLDVGTLVPGSRIGHSVAEAEVLLWFVRPTREELLILKHRMAECPQPDRVAVVLVGDRPYGADDVEKALEARVVHVLPIDRRGADAANLGGDDRYLRRSPLARSCAALAERLRTELWASMRDVGDDRSSLTLRDLAPPPPQESSLPSLGSAPEAQPSSSDDAQGDDSLVVWTPDSQ